MNRALTGLRAMSAAAVAPRRHPIAQVIPLRLADPDADVRLQDVVFGLRFREGQPLLDHGIVGFQHALIAIVQVDLPRHGHHEAAPHRPAAALVRVVGRGVRQIARLRVLRVAPVGRPAAVEAAGIEVEHARLQGRAGVAAVAQALARRAVHHVAAQGQAFVGPGHQPVDAIQQLVGTLELAGARVSRAEEQALNVRHRRRLLQPREVRVTEGVIVEAGAHGLARARARHVFVALVEGGVAVARGRVVGELDFEVLSRGQYSPEGAAPASR